MKASFLLNLTALLFTVIACEKDTIDDGTIESNCFYEEENYTIISDPSFSESGMIPMHLNNYWRYADSTWDENGNLTASGEFVIEPSEVGRYGDVAWWRTNFYPVQLIRIESECIFDLQTGLSGCANENLNYFTFDQDSVSIVSTVWGDIAVVVDAHKVSSVSTPAGTFADCFHYQKYGYDATTIKPTVGILKWSTGFENGSLEGRKLTLIEYYLE